MVDKFIDCKHGRSAITYPHPALAEVLEETYGVMVYQEQVMQAARILAGFSLGTADIMRRAMGKKNSEEMAQQRQRFVTGCVERGLSILQANEIFDLIDKFAGYGFNKSHSAAYAMIAYQTGWLKASYPVEFLAALLTCDADDTDKVVAFVMEGRRQGIEVLPPDINESDLDFSVVYPSSASESPRIRFGLGAVGGGQLAARRGLALGAGVALGFSLGRRLGVGRPVRRRGLRGERSRCRAAEGDREHEWSEQVVHRFPSDV